MTEPITQSYLTQRVNISRKLLESIDNTELALMDTIEYAEKADYLEPFIEGLEAMQSEISEKRKQIEQNLNFWELEAIKELQP